MFAHLKAQAKALKAELYALYYAAQDARTPWYAKALMGFTLAYAMSPIDLIPDFIPVLGYLDDLLIVPACIALSIRLIPAAVMDEARIRAREQGLARKPNWVAGAIILVLWVVGLGIAGHYAYTWYYQRTRRP
ncbi:YkvA family protein [Hymenobacter sp. BT730]|uniref:YkvA family protein n=1 Tax=Hymenobacter sp. BT730 TaxID=3063332 RepID=UPI0026DF714C|nr:YkvA family protein [Hymenobacter sp. BT730]